MLRDAFSRAKPAYDRLQTSPFGAVAVELAVKIGGVRSRDEDPMQRGRCPDRWEDASGHAALRVRRAAADGAGPRSIAHSATREALKVDREIGRPNVRSLRTDRRTLVLREPIVSPVFDFSCRSSTVRRSEIFPRKPRTPAALPALHFPHAERDWVPARAEGKT
jgi:hypothetical protein